jgi:hypothetical protein
VFFEFEYSKWAGFGKGSWVSFEDDWRVEMRFTLVALDGERATILFDKSLDPTGATRDLQPSTEMVVRARPEGKTLRSGRAKEKRGRPVERVVRTVPLAKPPPKYLYNEGDEVIEVMGDDRVCHWIKRRSEDGGKEDFEKLWILESVPGGIVRWESRPGGTPHVWKLKAFEAK